MIRPIVAMLVSLALPVGSAFAQIPEPESITIPILEIDDTLFPEIRALVTVVDSRGRPVENLTASSFVVEETGKPATLAGIGGDLDEEISVGIVLTIDTSGSMAEALIPARAAVVSFVQDLRPSDQTAVVSFATEVIVQAPLSADHNSALVGLDGLNALGDTALYAAVSDSIGLAQGIPLPRKAIILLSDGIDFGGRSAVTREESLAQASEAGVPIYSIGLGAAVDSEYLQALAGATGGAFLETPSADGIAELYNQLSELLRSQYTLTIQSSAPAEIEARSLTLTLSTASGEAVETVNYQTRRTIELTPAAEAPTAVPQAITIPPPISGSNDNLPLYVLLASLGAIVTLVASRFLFAGYRNRRVATEIAGLSQRAGQEVLPQAAEPRPRVEHGLVVSVEGPGKSDRYPVTNEPITIGTASTNQIQLVGGDDQVAGEHARIWMRDGRLVFHQIATGEKSTVRGEPVTWVSLSQGEEIQIGPYTLRVEGE